MHTTKSTTRVLGLKEACPLHLGSRSRKTVAHKTLVEAVGSRSRQGALNSLRTAIRVAVYQAERPEAVLSDAAKQQPISNWDAQVSFQTVIDMWAHLAQQHGDQVACREPHNHEAQDLSYSQVHSATVQAAAGLQSLGLEQGDRVALIAESSSRWIIADQASMMSGGSTAVRGSTAPPEELAYIVSHAECAGLIVQDAQALRNLAPQLSKPGMPALKFIVVMWGGVDEATRDLVGEHASATTACSLDHLYAAMDSNNNNTSQKSNDTSHSKTVYCGPPLLTFNELLVAGQQAMARGDWTPVRVTPDDLATLVYTSGTTGAPKGVMLSHGNLAYQVNNLAHYVQVRPGDTCLSLLPPWHIYQRTCTYYIHSRAGQIIFTTLRKFRDDLTTYPPDHLVAVPLVLDTLHTRVKAKLNSGTAVRKFLANFFLGLSTAYIHAKRIVDGVALQYAQQVPSFFVMLRAIVVATLLAPLHKLATKLVYSKIREALAVRRTIISGGGSLTSHLDDFFEIIGLQVVNGWGLSETSPVLACRRTVQNVRGTVGVPVPGTEVRVVDPETLQPLPPGSRGLLLARGPGVMGGYLNDEGASAKAFRAGKGWFDTGDLGWVVPEGSAMSGMVVLTGRAKDTIVLLSGKNVEPQPIEDAVCASPLVKFAMLLGQDKRELGMVIFPDLDALEAALAQQTGATASSGDSSAPPSAAAQHPLVHKATSAQLEALLLPQVNALNAARHDYHAEHHIAHVVVVTRGSLSPEDGTLTRTMKLRRAEVSTVYKQEVDALLHRLRG